MSSMLVFIWPSRELWCHRCGQCMLICFTFSFRFCGPHFCNLETADWWSEQEWILSTSYLQLPSAGPVLQTNSPFFGTCCPVDTMIRETRGKHQVQKPKPVSVIWIQTCCSLGKIVFYSLQCLCAYVTEIGGGREDMECAEWKGDSMIQGEISPETTILFCIFSMAFFLLSSPNTSWLSPQRKHTTQKCLQDHVWISLPIERCHLSLSLLTVHCIYGLFATWNLSFLLFIH